MSFTRLVALFLALAVPCAVYAQQPKKPRRNSGTTAAPQPPRPTQSMSPEPPRLTDEKVFFYFMAIYGAPSNAIERYGNYFDANNYRRAMADEFERRRYIEKIGALIADGIKRINFSDKFTLVGSSTFEGYTMLGEYSFASHSFPLYYVPYNSFCRNMDRSDGICRGTLMNVGQASAVNSKDFLWSVPMSEADANAFVKSRAMAQPGVVNRRVAARITYSIINKKVFSSFDGKPLFAPFIYSVEVFGDESLTRKLGVIQKVNSQTARTPEELVATEERIRQQEPEKLRDLLTALPVLNGKLVGGNALFGLKIRLRIVSFDAGAGTVTAEVHYFADYFHEEHSSQAVGNVSANTLNLTANWALKADMFGKVTKKSMHFKLRFDGLAHSFGGTWRDSEAESDHGIASFELK